MTGERSNLRSAVIYLGASLLSLALLAILPEGPARAAPAVALLWLLPLWPLAAFSSGRLLERLALAGGLSYLLQIIVLLLLSYLPGPFPRWLYLGGVALGAAGGALLLARKPPRLVEVDPPRPRRIVLTLVLLLASAVLRLPDLAYKEFQGDEAVVMIRAAGVMTGDDRQLFLHEKGPAEILIPLSLWSAAGQINEGLARLPFAWAGLFGVVAAAALTARWFGERAGWLAGLFMAINGFGVAFSRVVQYQNVVALLGLVALLAAARFRDSRRPADLILAATSAAAGLLAHYDAILIVPALLWAILASPGRTLPQRGALALAAAAGAAVAGLFYLPYATSASFGGTAAYLLQERVGLGSAGPWSWSGGRAWQMFTFYNSVWYAIGLLGLAAAGLVVAARQRRGLAAVLLLLVPLIFYALIVVDPRTHVYTIVPGAAVLGGLGGAWFARRLRARSGASLAASAAAGWFLLCAAYVALLFLQNHPERQRNWSSERPWPALFPVTWSEPPQYGLFGFPYQAGWRTLAANAGDLPQPFASNEEAEITAWYLAGRERTYCGDLTGFVLADNVQDPVPYETSWLESLSLQAAVESNGRQSLWLYRSGPAADEVKTFSGSTALWLRPESVTPRRPQFGVPVGVTLGDQVKLLGYDLPVRQARPGETIWLTLYWEALAPMAESYQVFVHLYDGEMRAQADGAPGCDLYPTPRWEPREVVRDPHRVQLPANLLPGTYPLLVGMYRLVDGERLAVDGRTDNAIPLTEIKVERGP